MIEDEEEEIADTLDDDQGDKGHDSHNPVVKEQGPFPPPGSSANVPPRFKP